MSHPDPALISLPPYVDYAAVYLMSITGAVAAIRRHYDWVGLFVLALCAGVGGALLRDALFIQNGHSVVLTNANYLLAVIGGCVTAALLHRGVDRIGRLFLLVDALGLGTYGVIGVTKALAAGLSVPAAILVGVVNAVGGSIIRDVLTNVEPLLFKPGQFYAVAALAGCGSFAGLSMWTEWPVQLSALIGIAVSVSARVFSIVFGWTTGAVLPATDGSVNES